MLFSDLVNKIIIIIIIFIIIIIIIIVCHFISVVKTIYGKILYFVGVFSNYLGNEMYLCGKSVRSWCDRSSDWSFMGWTHWAISRSSQCSTTVVTKAVVSIILSVGECI